MKQKLLLLALCIYFPLQLSSQVKKGFGGEIGMYNAQYGSFMGDVTLTYNWLIGNYFSVSVGAMLLYSQIDDIPSIVLKKIILLISTWFRQLLVCFLFFAKQKFMPMQLFSSSLFH